MSLAMAISVRLWITHRVIHRRPTGLDETLNDPGDAYQDMRQPDQAGACWQDVAAAMRDAGGDEAAAAAARVDTGATR
jgi:hypothetical protein